MRGFKKGIALCALVAMMGVSAPASAIDSLKPKLAPAKVKPITAEQFAELRSKLGACVVKGNKSKVAKYLANSDSMTVDYAALDSNPQMFFFYFNMQACMKYNVPQVNQLVMMKAGGLRNLLLESAYLDDEQAAPQPLLNEKGEPALAPARAFPTKGDGLAAVVSYAALADCVAAKDPALADGVLRTGAGLPDERKAAVALASVLSGCVQEGANVALTPASIRTIAAEGMWHRYANKTKTAVASK